MSYLTGNAFKVVHRSLDDVQGSVLPGFLLSFPSQIWVSDVTFVTFFGDKKCDASHLSHFWDLI